MLVPSMQSGMHVDAILTCTDFSVNQSLVELQTGRALSSSKDAMINRAVSSLSVKWHT